MRCRRSMGGKIDGETCMKGITERKEAGIKIHFSRRDYTFASATSSPSHCISWDY